MCGSPSSSGPPSSSGSPGPSGPSPDREGREPLDLRRFAAVLVLAYLLCWPLWAAASPAYDRFLGAAASVLLRAAGPRLTHQQVTVAGGAFRVHLWAKTPATGTRIDAGSVHFNWLVLLPLLAATRALGRGVPRAGGAVAAILGLAACHVLFLAAVGEYRALRMADAGPRLQEVLRFLAYFYFALGRVGLPVLLWMPIGLAALRPPPPRRTAGAAGAR